MPKPIEKKTSNNNANNNVQTTGLSTLMTALKNTFTPKNQNVSQSTQRSQNVSNTQASKPVVNNTAPRVNTNSIQNRSNFSSDRDYENYLLDNRIDTTKGDARDYLKQKASEQNTLPRQYLEGMRNRYKYHKDTQNVRSKVESGEYGEDVANDINQSFGVVLDENNNEIDLNQYNKDVELVQTTADNLKNKQDKIDKDYQDGKIDYNTYLNESNKITNAQNENVGVAQRLNGYTVKQGFDYYDWALENGRDVDDFERMVGSMDDNIIERLGNMYGASLVDTANIIPQAIDILHMIGESGQEDGFKITDEGALSTKLTNTSNELKQYAFANADGFENWSVSTIGSLMPMVNALLMGNVLGAVAGLTGGALTGAVSTFTNVALGAQTAGQVTRQRLEEGNNITSAVLNGAVHGTISGLVEGLDAGRVTELFTGQAGKLLLAEGLFSKPNMVRIARYMNAIGMSEGAEEIIEYFADVVADNAQNLFANSIDGRINVEYASAEDLANQFVMAYAGAFLMGAPTAVGVTINSKQKYNGAMEARKHFETILDSDLSSVEEKELASWAINAIDFEASNFSNKSELADAVDLPRDRVEPLGTYDELMNNLANAVRQDVQGELRTAQETLQRGKQLENDFQNALTERGYNVLASDYLSANENKRSEYKKLATFFNDNEINSAFRRLESGQNGISVDDGVIINTDQTRTLDIDALADLDEADYRNILKTDLNQIFRDYGAEASATTAIAHEITHFAEKSDKWNDLRDLVKEAMGTERFEKVKNRISDIYKTRNVTADPEREAVAFYIQKNLGSENFLEKLTKYDTSLFSRLLTNVRSLFSSDTLTKLENTFMKALVDSKRLVDVSTNSGSVAPVQASIGSWEDTDKDALAKAILDELNENQTLGSAPVTMEQVESWIDSVESVSKMIADDIERLGYVSNSTYSAMKSNSDYKFTIDMSTLCKKRLLLQGTIDAVQNAMPNIPLTSMDYITIRSLLAEKGFEVSCGFCYVESARRKVGEVAQQYIEKEGLDDVTVADLVTVNGVEELQRTRPEIYEGFVKFNNARGQAREMLVQTRTEYKGEIRNLKEGTIASLIASGGLRLQSYSDFETPHLIDMMQVVLDMASVGLTSQAYTKVPNFADAFGNTNIKINLSLVCKGLDENGELVFDDVEGMPHEEAFRLREKYSKNVGTILVGRDDATILKAMADPRIDYIIPYHRSGWANGEYELLGITGYSDYTKLQHEKLIKPKRYRITQGENKGKLGKPTTSPRGGDILPLSYWDFSKTGTENAETYLQLCAEQGRIPKFPNFLVDNEDGSWSLQPDGSTDGYWKTLIDFKMYDNDGIGAPQERVVPIFDDEVNARILNEYQGGHRSLQANQDVVREFLEGKKNGKYSLGETNSDGNVLTDQQASYFQNSKIRDDNGNLMVVYHGTDADFTEFDRSKSRSTMDIQGNFFSPWEIDAGGYGKNVGAYYLNITNPADEQTAYQALRMFQGQNDAGAKARDYLIEQGYDGVNNGNEEYIAFYPEQIKRIDNASPTDSPNIQYSLGSKDRIDDVNNPDYYKYDNLIKQKNLTYHHYDNADYSNISNSKKLELIKDKALKQGALPIPNNKGFAVVNSRTGEKILCNRESLLHNTSEGDISNEKFVIAMNVAELLNDAILINKGYDDKYNNGTPSNVYMTEATVDGIPYLVRFMVHEGVLTNYSASKLHALGIEKRSEQSESSSMRTSNKLSVAQLLEDVNNSNNFDTDLPLNVYYKYKKKYKHKEQSTRGLRYSLGESGGDGGGPIKPDVEVTDGYAPRKNQRFATSNIPKSDIFNDSQKARVEQKVKAGEFTYQSYINKVEAQRAEDYYKIDGKEATFNRFMAINNPDMKSTVMGEILLKHMLEENDPRWEEVASKLADDATIAGQFLQAYAMMQKLAPQGKLMAIRRNMERLQKRVNNRFGNKAPRLELNQKLVDDLMNASPKESKQIQDAIYKDLMNQIPKTFRDTINAWRYLAMLGNPRTHIRNMAGNGIFAPAINIKDAIGTVLESIASSKLDYKTKAFINRFNASDRALLEAGNKAFDTYKSALEQSQKYEKSGFSDNNPIGRLLNRLANKNSELLDKEDFFFSKRRYAKAYAQFLKANNLTPDNLSGEMENRANSYAELEALRATYRDANSVAELLGKISSDSDSEGLRMASYFKDALIPFTKTPMNIVKRGVRYSPVGLLYTITKNSYDLHTGKINANEYIDSLAQGLTGTGIALLGMLLRSLGLFRTKDDDKDRKQYFDAENGEQDYAIDLSPFGVEGTYTIDWASPVIMPFAIGAELFDAFTDLEGFEGFEDVTNAIADVSAKVMDPIMETSMLSSLQDALKSYSTEGGEWLGEMVASMASSYFQQLFPTLGGQIARTIDDTRRTTYPNSGTVDKTIKQIMNKIPWLSTRNQPYINRQGQEEKTEDLGMGWVGRAFLNMVSPGYYSSKDIDEYDEELYRLYDSTMSLDAFPSSTSTKITHEGTDMKFTPEEYTEWHKMRWQTETKYVNDFIDSQSYQSLTDEERVATIKDIREYAQKVAKKQFLESKGYIYTDDKELAETDSKYVYDKQLTNAQGALDNDIPLYAFYDYLNNAGSKQAEKMQYLENSGLSQKQKEYLWDTEGYKKSYNDVYKKVFGGKSKSSGKSSGKSSAKKSGIKKGSGSKSGKATTLKATSTTTNNVNTRIANSYFNAYSNQMGRRNVSTGGSSSTTCPRCKNVVVPVNGRCPICGNILE